MPYIVLIKIEITLMIFVFKGQLLKQGRMLSKMMKARRRSFSGIFTFLLPFYFYSTFPVL